jgi:hypothetical protein
MSSASWPRAAFSYLRNAVSAPTSACIVAAVVLANILPTTDDRAVFLKSEHPETCRTCATSSAEDRARLDASLIARGAMDAPSASNRL